MRLYGIAKTFPTVNRSVHRMQPTLLRGQLAACARTRQNGVWPLELGLERSSSSVRPWRRRPRTVPFRRAFRAKFRPQGNIWTCVLPLLRSTLRKKLLPSHRCRAAAVLASRNRSGCRRWARMACDLARPCRISCDASAMRVCRSRDCLISSQRRATWDSVQKASRAYGSCKRLADNRPS